MVSLIKPILLISNKLKFVHYGLLSAAYSQYGPYYHEPIFKRDQIQELKDKDEFKKLTFVAMKAAKTHDSCSLFNDERIEKFINYIMRKGEKELARNLLEATFENIKRHQIKRYHESETDEEKSKIILNPREIFYKAVDNCMPVLELMPIKRGGVTYRVPVSLKDSRSQFIAMRWIVDESKIKERTIHLPEKMCWVLLDAFENKGNVVKKKNDLHRQCEANKAYAHYRWG